MDRVDIQGVLAQMRDIRSQVNVPEPSNPANSQFANTIQQMQRQIDSASPSSGLASADQSVNNAANVNGDVPSFGDMFKSAVDTVANNQSAASQIATAYEKGDPSVDLPEVMIALQKSSVSFQAMTQVRNKMIEAYKEIINMPL